MSKVRIYDKAMCCSTGVCGPQVDPELARFAGDLEWLKTRGHRVERFNLAQQPEAFTTNSEVQQLLQSEGVDCLPVVMVDDNVVSRAVYPSRENLAEWTAIRLVPGPVQKSGGGSCCDSDGCC